MMLLKLARLVLLTVKNVTTQPLAILATRTSGITQLDQPAMAAWRTAQLVLTIPLVPCAPLGSNLRMKCVFQLTAQKDNIMII